MKGWLASANSGAPPRSPLHFGTMEVSQVCRDCKVVLAQQAPHCSTRDTTRAALLAQFQECLSDHRPSSVPCRLVHESYHSVVRPAGVWVKDFQSRRQYRPSWRAILHVRTFASSHGLGTWGHPGSSPRFARPLLGREEATHRAASSGREAACTAAPSQAPAPMMPRSELEFFPRRSPLKRDERGLSRSLQNDAHEGSSRTFLHLGWDVLYAPGGGEARYTGDFRSVNIKISTPYLTSTPPIELLILLVDKTPSSTVGTRRSPPSNQRKANLAPILHHPSAFRCPLAEPGISG